jgi:hypothetical protein
MPDIIDLWVWSWFSGLKSRDFFTLHGCMMWTIDLVGI